MYELTIPVVPACFISLAIKIDFSILLWKCAVNHPLHRTIFFNISIIRREFRADKNAIPEHELSLKRDQIHVLWEFIPHSSDKWPSMLVSLIKHPIDVVNEIIAEAYRITDYFLNSFRLEPWFSLLIVDFIVGSEEWIENTKLVHHDPEIFWRNKFIPWDIGTSEWVSCNSLGE